MDCIFGNSFCIINNQNKPIIQTPDLFQVYFDTINQTPYAIKMFIDGAEKKTFKPEDIWHFKNYKNSYQGLGDSIIDYCYSWLVFHRIAVEVNANMLERGNLGIVLPIFEKEMSKSLQEKVPTGTTDKNGDILKSRGEIILKAFRNLFGGWKNSHKMTMILTGVKDVLELGKNNNEMQLKDLIEYAENKIYDAFGVEKTGEYTTYNNAKTFNYEMYDNVGRPRELEFEKFINNFIWKKYIETEFGFSSADNCYFAFNKPNDPDEINKQEFTFKVFIESLKIGKPVYSLDEIRDKLGEAPASQELLDAWQEIKTNQNLQFNNQKKNPVQLALESDLYYTIAYNQKTGNKEPKGFLASFEKAITKQIETFAKLYNENQKANFPKLETFYSFNALKKDYFKWIDFGQKLAEKEIQGKLKFASLDYSSDILKWVEDRVEGVLKGNDVLESVDIATQEQVFTAIKNSVEQNLAIADIVKNIINSIPQIAKSRAKLIASMETAAAVEFARFDYFKKEGFTKKKHLAINDGRDTIWSLKAQDLGWVDIDYKYDTQFGRKSATLPLHFRDRGTLIFK
jgi:hypothetical protein